MEPVIPEPIPPERIPPARIVIVGAGQAGGRTAEALRQQGFRGSLLLIGAEEEPPYERPALSKDFLSGATPAERLLVRPPEWWNEQGVDLRLGVTAEGIDRSAARLRLSNGEKVAYDALVLATGSRPRLLPLRSDLADLADRVQPLRSLGDARRLAPRLKAGTRVVVIGGGFIGLEVAATAVAAGASATVVEASPQPLARVAPAPLGRWMAERHRRRGVTLLTGEAVDTIRRDGGELSVVLSGGTGVAADVVVVGIGVRPNMELAGDAGIAIADGILCDAFGATDAPGIWAAGDVSCHFNPLAGRHARLESWQNAQNQAIAVARNLISEPRPYAEVPWIWSDQFDINLQMCGWLEPDGDLHLRGDPDSGRFIAMQVSRGCVNAAWTFNQGREMRILRRLVGTRKPVDPEALRDPGTPLADIAAALAKV